MSPRRIAIAVATALVVALAGPVSAGTPATGAWAALGTAAPLQDSLFTAVLGMKPGPDGNLYAYGWFTNAGGDPTADYLAVYEPATATWHGLGSNGAGDGVFNAPVRDVAWWGSTLFVAGEFTNAAGIATADYLAAWTGSAWTARTGSTASGPSFSDPVNRLVVSGGYLYAGGSFHNVDTDDRADLVVAWDGRDWTPLVAADALVAPLPDGSIHSMAAGADGTIYVGGVDALGQTYLLARWLPASRTWDGLDQPIQFGNPGEDVMDLAVVGASVYAAGSFTAAGGTQIAFGGCSLCTGVAKWLGAGKGWVPLGTDGAGGPSITGSVTRVAPYGSTLIVAGDFTGVGGIADVAVFNGTSWQAISLAPAAVMAATTMGRTLYVGGMFANAGGIAAADTVAAYGLPAPPTAPRSVGAATGSGRLMVSWAAPASSNGSPVTGYLVQTRKKGTTSWRSLAVGAGVRSATVTGLAHGATYEVRVLARSFWGTGVASPILLRKVP